MVIRIIGTHVQGGRAAIGISGDVELETINATLIGGQFGIEELPPPAAPKGQGIVTDIVTGLASTAIGRVIGL